MALPTAIARVNLFPTPFATDVVFYEARDADLPINKNPEYGTPHPNPVLFPHHKLVYIAPVSRDTEGKQYWYYAAERENQDEYNFSFTQADIGPTKFDAVSRLYVTLREEFDPLVPVMGDVMPDVPRDKFTGTYVLAQRRQIPIQDETLASLFVAEEHVYVTKIPLIDIEIDRETGKAHQITTTLYYLGELVSGTAIEDLFADETNAFWDLDADGFGNVGRQLSENWFEVTQRKWINLDDIWEWSVDRRRPNKYLCPSGSVTTTTITVGNVEGPLAEEDLPAVSEGEAITIIKWGEITKTITVTDEGTEQTLYSSSLMSSDGKTYPVSNELVANDELLVVEGGIDDFGQVMEIQEIDGCRAAAITRQAISLEDKDVLAQSYLYPEKFVKDGKTEIVEETETGGGLGTPVLPSATVGESVLIEQKGRVRTTKTTTQTGELTALAGLDLNNQDGKIYPSTDEVVLLTEVPVTEEAVDTNGIAITYTPVDANTAVKQTRKVVSTEDQDKLVYDRLAPEKFFLNGGGTTITVVTEPGVVDPAPIPAPDPYQRVTVEQKGVIRTTETLEQTDAPQVLNGTTFDQRTGEGFIEENELVGHDTVTPSEVDASGDVVIYQPINPNFAVKTTKKVASTTSRTWQDIINYEWPPVLQSVTYQVYSKKNGGQLIVPIVRYKEGYSGPQLVTVTQYWQKDAIVPVSPLQMIPRGFTYINPYFDLKVPPCLHGEITMTLTIGTEDPVWELGSFSETFDATNYTDWPSSIEWVESKPYNGGYLVTEYTINSPVE